MKLKNEIKKKMNIKDRIKIKNKNKSSVVFLKDMNNFHLFFNFDLSWKSKNTNYEKILPNTQFQSLRINEQLLNNEIKSENKFDAFSLIKKYIKISQERYEIFEIESLTNFPKSNS